DSGVTLIDPLGRRGVAFVPIADHPRALAFSPSGHRIYVALRGGLGLAVIDRYAHEELDGIALPSAAATIRIDPLGPWLLAPPPPQATRWGPKGRCTYRCRCPRTRIGRSGSRRSWGAPGCRRKCWRRRRPTKGTAWCWGPTRRARSPKGSAANSAAPTGSISRNPNRERPPGMRLSRLELSGFKSFAGTVELPFEAGVTAIVGPNGCGKSNISDAVRWVLGEQSPRLLRGGKMEDVIFQGSTGRRPVNVAEVSLVFVNSDGTLPIAYKEVLVTR